MQPKREKESQTGRKKEWDKQLTTVSLTYTDTGIHTATTSILPLFFFVGYCYYFLLFFFVNAVS